GAVDDEVEAVLVEEQSLERGAVPNVYGVVLEARVLLPKPREVPARIALGTEEIGTHVVVHAGNPRGPVVEVCDELRTDESARTSDEYAHLDGSGEVSLRRPLRVCM